MNTTNTNRNYLLGGAIIVLLIIIAIIWSLRESGTGMMATSTAATTTTSVTTGTKSLGTGTKVSATTITQATTVSTYIKKDSTNVYLYTDTDPSGNAEYNVVADADPATFAALTQLVDVEKPTEKDGLVTTSLGSGSAAYYKDKNHVYVLSVFTNGALVKTGIEVVQDATPATFKVLSSIYGKDASRVFALQVPPDATPHTPGSYTWEMYDMKAITGADPATFVVANGTNYDAHDASHEYRGGVMIGNYPS